MPARRRILVSIGFVVLGAVIVVLAGFPYVRYLTTERSHLTHKIADLGRQLSQEQTRVASLQEKVDTQDQQIATADLRHHRLEAWRASEQQTAQQAAVHTGDLRDQLDTAQGAARRAQQANARLQHQIDEQRAQSAAQGKQLAERNDALAQAREQQQKLETRLADQQQTAEQAVARIGDLSGKLDTAQAAAKQAQQTSVQLQHRLDEQQALLAAQKKQLAERGDALARTHEQRQKLEAQLATGQQSAQQHAARISELTNSLQQARDQQQALQTRIEAAHAAQQHVETQVADLERALASAQHSATPAASAALAPATGGNEPLQRRLAELQTQLNRYTAQRQAAEQPAAHDSDDLAAAQQRAAKLTATYKAQLENAARLKRVNTDTLDQLAAARNALEKAQAEIARIEGARGIYTVQGGDSLSLIAAFFYHNGNRWPQIFKSNAFLVSNPDLIFPGMVLVIPE